MAGHSQVVVVAMRTSANQSRRISHSRVSSTSSAIKSYAMNYYQILIVSLVVLAIAQQAAIPSNAFTLTNQELQSTTNENNSSSLPNSADLQQSANQMSATDKGQNTEREGKSSLLTGATASQEAADQEADEPFGPTTTTAQQAQKKLIISRYRLRGNGLDKTLSSRQLANYSQPFDLPPLTAPTNHWQQPLARALTGFVHAQDLPGSYAYLTAASQRAASVHPSGTHTTNDATATTAGLTTAPASVLPDEQSSPAYSHHDGGGGGGALTDYTPPLQHVYPGSLAMAPAGRQLYSSSVGPMLATGRLRMPPSTSASGELNASPYIMASPSSVGPYAATDLLALPGGGASGFDDHHQHGGGGGYHDYYDNVVGYPMLANYSARDQSALLTSNGYSLPLHGLTTSHTPADFGLAVSPYSRSRWSWPWSDTSNAGSLASATFKKHRVHHHMPHQMHHYKDYDHHNQHLHHDDHDHLMPKWEHGISIGEIACVAVAVVLGIIILGSPFFLLFLMLFNGGNLFGATQMGLLAPAAAVPTGVAAGKRRRRRSIQQTTSGAHSGSPNENRQSKSATKEKDEFDLPTMGEYLFHQISPFLEADKLMRTFARIMEVKDDVEKLVSKLNLRDQRVPNMLNDKQQQMKSQEAKSKEPKSSQHIEMRRRRKK